MVQGLKAVFMTWNILQLPERNVQPSQYTLYYTAFSIHQYRTVEEHSTVVPASTTSLTVLVLTKDLCPALEHQFQVTAD